MENKTRIETYNGVDIFYNKENGKLYFDFEGEERVVNYFFEAIEIIDEPRWEACDLKGFYIEGMLEDSIGKVVAKRRNIKTGKPDWMPTELQWSLFDKKTTVVYPASKKNIEIYRKFEKQENIVSIEREKLKDIVSSLIPSK